MMARPLPQWCKNVKIELVRRDMSISDLAKLVGQPFQWRLKNDLPRVLHACSSRFRPATVASPCPGQAGIWGVRWNSVRRLSFNS